MDQQKYLNDITDKAILYLKASEKNKNDFSNMFNNNDTLTLLEFVESLNDEQLYDYFKISQISLDLHNIFTEIGSFIHFCKKIGVELDLSVLNKSDKLLSFVSNFQPFKLEFIPNEDGVLVEGNKKNIDAKFNEFKKSINRAIKII